MGDAPIFVDGLRVFAPRGKAPAWVKADIMIDCAALAQWMQRHAGEDGKVNVQVRESKGGKLYACLDAYRSKRDGDNRPVEKSGVPCGASGGGGACDGAGEGVGLPF